MEIFFASATTDHSLEFEERGDKAGYSQDTAAGATRKSLRSTSGTLSVKASTLSSK
jgi:hypothetical protein